VNPETHEKSTADPNAIRDQDRAEREQQARQLGRDPVTNALGNEADLTSPGKVDDEQAWQNQQDESKSSRESKSSSSSSSSHKK
jgi:hypothetical protein